MNLFDVGFQKFIDADRITALMPNTSNSAIELRKDAIKRNIYLNLTCGRALKTLIILDNGMIVGSAKRIEILLRLKKYKNGEKE